MPRTAECPDWGQGIMTKSDPICLRVMREQEERVQRAHSPADRWLALFSTGAKFYQRCQNRDCLLSDYTAAVQGPIIGGRHYTEGGRRTRETPDNTSMAWGTPRYHRSIDPIIYQTSNHHHRHHRHHQEGYPTPWSENRISHWQQGIGLETRFSVTLNSEQKGDPNNQPSITKTTR